MRSNVRITTLAGDEYSLALTAPIAAASQTQTPAPEPAAEAGERRTAWVDAGEYAEIAAACVRIHSYDADGSWATGFVLASGVLVTSRPPFRDARELRVESRAPEQKADVLNGTTEEPVLVLRAANANDLSESAVRVDNPPFRVAGGTRLGVSGVSQQAGSLRPEDIEAVIMGFDGDQLRAMRGLATIETPDSRRFEVRIESDEAVPSSFVGGPVIMEGRVCGIVLSAQGAPVPESGQASTRAWIITAASGTVIDETVRAAASSPAAAGEGAETASGTGAGAREQAQPQTAGAAPADNEVLPPELRQLPDWVAGACVELHGLGDNITPVAGFFVDERHVVTAAQAIRGIPILNVRQGSRAQQARVLAATADSALRLLELIDDASGRAQPFDTHTGYVSVARLATSLTEQRGNTLLVPSDATIVARTTDGFQVLHGRVRTTDSRPSAFEVRAEEHWLPASWLGALVLIRGETAGVVTGIDNPVLGDAQLQVTGFPVIRQALERVDRVARQQTGDTAEVQQRVAERAWSSGAHGYRFARVLVVGDAGSGRGTLMRALAASREPVASDLRRTIWWEEEPRVAPELHAGVVLYKALTDDWWPIAFDLEQSALIMVLANVHGASGRAQSWAGRLRAAAPVHCPILFVGSRADTLDDDAKSMSIELEGLARSDTATWPEPPRLEPTSTIVSAERAINIDRLRTMILRNIDWARQVEVQSEAFARARNQTGDIIRRAGGAAAKESRPGSASGQQSILRGSPLRFGWYDQLAPLLGERRLRDGTLVIDDPARFEDEVLAIMQAVRDNTLGAPAARLAELERTATWAVDIAGELQRIGEGRLIDTDAGRVIVVPRWLKGGTLPRDLAEPAPLLMSRRLQGATRDVCSLLAARFAYTSAVKLVGVGCDTEGRGRLNASIGGATLQLDLRQDERWSDLEVRAARESLPEKRLEAPLAQLDRWLNELHLTIPVA